jgi:type I restriction enzyme S subunit
VRDHWQIGPLKRFTQTITDGAHVSPETEGGVYPFVSTRDVFGESIDFESCLRTSESSFASMVKTGCKPIVGDVLFSKDGTIGRTTVVAEDRDFVVASSLIIIRPDRRLLDSRFLHRLCQSALVTSQVQSLTKGAGLPRLSIENLTSIVVSVPPIEEQQLIAAFLDAEVAKLDALVLEQQRLIDLLNEKRQAVISHAVTKGLNPDAPMKPSGVEWLGDVPAHWKVLPIKRDVEFVTSGSRGWAENYSDEGAPFIRIANLTRDGIDLEIADVQRVVVPAGTEGMRTRVRPDDLLFSITAYLGSVALVPVELEPAYVSQHVALVRLRGALLRPRWVAFCALSNAGKAWFDMAAYGGTKIQLSLDDVRDLVVPVPPKLEQDQVTAYLETELERIRKLTAEAECSIELLQERRSALISAAVTGEVEPRGVAAVEVA